MKGYEARKKYHMAHYFAKWYTPAYYTVPEIARYLRVTPATILNYIAAGEMTAEKLGNSYRITVDDLEDFLFSRSKGLQFKRERRCCTTYPEKVV